MNEAYKRLPADMLKRIQKLEIFDEFEEWNLIMDHYCIAVAHRCPKDSTLPLHDIAL